MVFLLLIGFDGDEAVYRYWPESRDAIPGIVSVVKSTGERRLFEQSPDDPTAAYAGHAWRTIEKMLKAGDVIDEMRAAWY